MSTSNPVARRRMVPVNDDGGSRIEVTITGMNWAGEEIVTYSFSRRVARGI